MARVGWRQDGSSGERWGEEGRCEGGAPIPGYRPTHEGRYTLSRQGVPGHMVGGCAAARSLGCCLSFYALSSLIHSSESISESGQHTQQSAVLVCGLYIGICV